LERLIHSYDLKFTPNLSWPIGDCEQVDHTLGSEGLTPKSPLSPLGTIWSLGKFQWPQFLVKLFETFSRDGKTDQLRGNIIFISTSAHKQKLYHKKPKF